MSIKKDIKSFTEPMGDAIKNIHEDIQYAKEDTKKDGKSGKGNGCLKFIIYGLVIIMLMIAVSKCTSSSEEASEASVSQTSQNQTVSNKEMSEEIKTESQTNENKSSDNSKDTYSAQNNDSLYLRPQNIYARKFNIKLNDFSTEQEQLDKFLENDNLEEVNVENTGTFSTEYKVTADRSAYVYYGNIKDNRPNGYGVLMKISEFDYGLGKNGQTYYNIVYIGAFKDGCYDGYGMEFNVPEDSEEYMIFENVCKYDKGSDEYFAYYMGWINYVTYNGYFKKGKRDGAGNQYITYIGPFIDAASINNTNYDEELSNVRYPYVSVGEFKNGDLNGNTVEYEMGILRYTGEMKDSKKNGKGKTFFNNGNIEYDGEFKNDMRHGKGKLYSENSDFVYDGEWRNDDYR